MVVTRAAEQSKDLVGALERAGARAIVFPVIRIAPPEDFAALDSALRSGATFDWILFTSQNAVKAVRERASQLRERADFGRAKVGVVGGATAEEARLAGFSVTHVASHPLGRTLVDDLAEELRGKKIFLPRSDRADLELLRALEACRAGVTEAIAYRTIPGQRPGETAQAEIARADAVLFFSPSAVAGFFETFGAGAKSYLGARAVAVVGPVTRAALRAAGVGDAIVADEASVAGVVEALAHFFQQREQGASSGAKSA